MHADVQEITQPWFDFLAHLFSNGELLSAECSGHFNPSPSQFGNESLRARRVSDFQFLDSGRSRAVPFLLLPGRPVGRDRTFITAASRAGAPRGRALISLSAPICKLCAGLLSLHDVGEKENISNRPHFVGTTPRVRVRTFQPVVCLLTT